MYAASSIRHKLQMDMTLLLKVVLHGEDRRLKVKTVLFNKLGRNKRSKILTIGKKRSSISHFTQ